MYNLEDALGFQVNMTANAMKNRFNAFLKPYNLTSEQHVIMKSVQENPDITPTGLAEITFKDKTTITRMIDTLVKNDMLLRIPKIDDRRAYQIQWSDKGEKIMTEIIPIVENVIVEQRASFSKDELSNFLKTLEKLKNYPCQEN